MRNGETADGDRRTVAFPRAGVFPFHCDTHWEAGMAGAVYVR